jgi:hypothetical protein
MRGNRDLVVACGPLMMLVGWGGADEAISFSIREKNTNFCFVFPVEIDIQKL